MNPGAHPQLPATHDASDPEAVAKLQREQVKREKDEREALGILLSHPAGRNWIWEILGSCSMFGTTTVFGASDASAYNEGRRSVALQMWASLERADSEALIRLLKEKGKA